MNERTWNWRDAVFWLAMIMVTVMDEHELMAQPVEAPCGKEQPMVVAAGVACCGNVEHGEEK